ncbi:DUF3592 domain-containing protein [Streptomyces sp. NPDC020807]|uniref:DUF3592 domain-containing protein n=1 Tax=Streptomyces sp. NPDC020807 TaxID=3155119 RepID=UPI0033C7F09C
MESSLSGRGISARFNGARLSVVRDGTTWTIPLRAIAYVGGAADRAEVRIAISGPDSGGARHGLGGSVVLAGPNRHAATAFADHVRASLAGVEPAEDGHALVTVERPPLATLPTGDKSSRAVLIGFLVCLYVGALWAVGATGPRPAGQAVASLTVGGALLALGAVGLWRVARRFRNSRILRTRGIGVVGQVDGYLRIWTSGGHTWVFPHLSYTTADGRRFEGVTSAVSAGWDVRTAKTTEVLYDSADPRRAGVPPTAGFLARSTVLGLVSLFPLLLGLLAILMNTSLSVAP